jgi:hypothetical protein
MITLTQYSTRLSSTRGKVFRSIPRLNSAILSLVLCVGATNSGCMTTLGYVPEHLKPSDKTTFTPTYSEVKKWAYDVADGYDSRATMNRQAIYVGALLAAAAVGAIAGLAAFDTGHSWIVGIPIGTAFAGSVLAIYSSEEKGHIYRLASEYVKDLVTKSDRRLVRRRLATQAPATALTEAQQAVPAAQQRRQQAEQELHTQKQQANAAHTAADNAAAGPQKDALTKSAQALDQEVAKATQALADADVVFQAAQERVDKATKRNKAWNELVIAEAALATANAAIPPNPGTVSSAQARVTAADAVWADFTRSEEHEAFCLRDDINSVMRRVEEHKALLDPKNVAARLQAIKAPQTSTQSTTSAASGATTPQVSPENLSDLQPPAKSACDTDV